MMCKNKPDILISAAVLAATFSSALSAGAMVNVLDKTHYPAESFLAYTEFELSGEPLAESLGLDLDMLDPSHSNQPTVFDYSAGIESYEYSEEAMYALNYQSTMGPHIANGPRNKQRGGSLENLGARFVEMANAVGFPVAEIPQNIYPISLPYLSGVPELAQPADVTAVNFDEIKVTTETGKSVKHQTMVPAYFRDYQSLAWDRSTFDRTIAPATLGGILLKEVMWSQDFLGGMHTTIGDEEVDAESSTMDQNEKYSLGVSAADGFNGMVLTELSIDKLLIMQGQLGFDGDKLGAVFGPDYDPAKAPIWFAHRVDVTEGSTNGVNAIVKLKVSDSRSTLRDSWLTLWPLSEFFAFTDQRSANTAQNPGFLAVFDGSPYASAPKQNVDANDTNDVIAEDAFSLASNISNLVFKNLQAMHFNARQGTFVTEYHKGQQGQEVNTFDSAYAMVALSIFQRAQDALPVGYASGDSGNVDLKTKQGEVALTMIKAQADFILNKLIRKDGLVTDGLTLGSKEKQGTSLESQFAAIRGLVAAFLATGDARYQSAARGIYVAVERQMYDKNIGTWANKPGTATIHTPYTAAAISGGLRDTILHLKNQEGENEPALELERLTNRYAAWFKTVINGGMQLSEWLGDSGENHLRDRADNNDSDEDGVPKITAAGGKYGTAMTMANKVSVE